MAWKIRGSGQNYYFSLFCLKKKIFIISIFNIKTMVTREEKDSDPHLKVEDEVERRRGRRGGEEDNNLSVNLIKVPYR